MKKILTLAVALLSLYALPNIASAGCGSCGVYYDGYSSYYGYSYPSYYSYPGYYNYPSYYSYTGFYFPGIVFGIPFGY